MTIPLPCEPIAIVGMGCRFPGDAENPQAFWQMICEGRDGITELPPNRWDVTRFYDPDPNKPGKSYTKHGGYLRQPIDQMDALFFGISPREAENLDPQQRILLEVAWEALEDAGIPPDALAGSATGVFVGGLIMDHVLTKTNPYNRDQLNTHGAISFTHTLLSARIAYTLDLRGPCISLDTACSSSLVALHQACQAIHAGEADLALVGGVNVMYRAEPMVALCKSHFLAEDGRSKSFDARGDGYGRGEGAGIVVIKPLSAAKRDGDLIYAVIRGTGINQDGHTDGITVPNEHAQADLIRHVCDKAGVLPAQLSYFEAHGTGTAVGDPKECTALGSVVGQKRSAENACWVGSVKANIGHLEAAAGVAGVIKTAFCLQERQIPPVANLETPNPAIDFVQLGLRLPRRLESLADDDTELPIAGINSFGYGGTNAHAILQAIAAKPETVPLESPNNYYFLPLSARHETALADLAQRYYDFLVANPELNLHDVCWSAATRRSHHHFRVAIMGTDRTEVLEQLTQFAAGNGSHFPNARIAAGQSNQQPVFVYTGMGPQWWGMGRELFEREPVFREMVECCDKIFQRIAGWSILAEMQRDEADSQMVRTHIAQPANFVLQAALTELWRSKGIEPAAIVGHSVGEVTAAYVAGVLSLEDALMVSYHRSRLQATTAGQGKMLAVSLTEAEAQALVDKYGAQYISLGAINSPTSLTLAGDAEILTQVAAELDAQGIFNRFLQVELAYHSPIMQPLRPEMLKVLADLKPQLPTIPMYSTVTGAPVTSLMYDSHYWYDNIREPVLFAKAIADLSADGHEVFLEVGPHPVLSNALKETLASCKAKPQVVSSLHRKAAETARFYRALGELYTQGCLPDWETLYPQRGQFVRLPLYPWQRETYWLEHPEAKLDRVGNPDNHPLLGQRLNTPTQIWEQPINEQGLPWLVDHQVDALVVLPGASYVEVGLSLLQTVAEEAQQAVLENLQFERALVVNPENEPLLHTQYDPIQRTYRIYSRSLDKSAWQLHARGRLSLVAPPPLAAENLSQVQERCPIALDIPSFYQNLVQRGFQYGRTFQAIQEMWRGEDEIVARIVVPADIAERLSAYRLHPTQLDAVFQAIFGIVENHVYLPVSIERVRFYAPVPSEFWAYGHLTQRSDDYITGDFQIFDAQGKVLVDLKQVLTQRLVNQTQPTRNPEDWIYQVNWDLLDPLPITSLSPQVANSTLTEVTPMTDPQPLLIGHWLFFMDQARRLAPLAAHLVAEGCHLTYIYQGESYTQTADSFTLRPQQLSDMQQLFAQLQEGDYRGVIYGWGLDCESTHDPDGSLAGMDWVYLLQSMNTAHPNQYDNYLYMLTQNAQAVGNSEFNVAQSTLVGLGRNTASEYNMHCRLIDLPTELAEITELLATELLTPEIEMEIALRNQQRLAFRVKSYALDDMLGTQQKQRISVRGDDSFALAKHDDQYHWYSDERDPVPPGKVEIHVEHAIIPAGGWTANQANLVPVSGRITTAANPDETPNTPVVALLPLNELRNYVCLSPTQLYTLPQTDAFSTNAFFNQLLAGMHSLWGQQKKVGYATHTASQASTSSLLPFMQALYTLHKAAPIPDAIQRAAALLPFMQAMYALQTVARVQPGERVLIHADAGNLDLAAVQVALTMQAEVFATYQSEQKRETLQALGVSHVLSVRDLGFADDIMAVTQNAGVHVVLNTLEGEFAEKSLELLTPFGRFINFKSTEQANDWQIAAKPAANISLHEIDIGQWLAQYPTQCQELLGQLKIGFDKGLLTPFEVPVFSVSQANQALSVAKEQTIALEMGAADWVNALSGQSQRSVIRNDGSYLITGGFGGFGLIVARWLAAQGAKSIVLAGRKGAATAEAQAAVTELEAQGITVFAAVADVSKEADVVQLVDDIQAHYPPLIGIFHAAGILNDSMLANLEPEHLYSVMQPKALAAWHLHQHTLDIALDCFVMFSSVSALIGKPGQANYCAANAFIDFLAHARQAQGLAGQSINWGALAEVGMAARQQIDARLERMGVGTFTADEGMQMLDYAMHSQDAQVGLMNVNWQAMQQTQHAPFLALRYGHLIDTSHLNEENPVAVLQRELAELDEDGQLTHLSQLLIGFTQDVMHLPDNSVDANIPLNELGLDSLMSVELRGAIESRTGVALSVLEIMQGSNISQLSEKIIERTQLAA